MANVEIEKIHNTAIEKSELAFLAKFKGDVAGSIILFDEAFEIEKSVALMAKQNNIEEPSLSILLKSAANLAIHSKKFDEAEKLICLALSGNPPFEIAEELRDLYETVNFDNHLKLRGVELSDDDLQLVFVGDSVGHGMVKSNHVLPRLSIFEKISHRTVERKAKKPFKESSKLPADLKQYDIYYNVAVRASFGLIIKIGQPTNQPDLFGTASADIISDIIDNIDLVNNGDFVKLKEKIPEEDYYNNFIGLSKELAPDGKDITMVGITCMRNGEEKRTKLTRNRNEFNNIVSVSEMKVLNEDSKPITLTGRLCAADDTDKKIKLEIDTKKIPIIVPKGLGDIVKGYWDEQVTIVGHEKKDKNGKKFIELTQIDPA
jgi:hypothetical protein